MVTRINTPSNFSEAVGGLRFMQGQAQATMGATTGTEDLVAAIGPSKVEDFGILLTVDTSSSATTPAEATLLKRKAGSATTLTLATATSSTAGEFARGVPSSATSLAELVCAAGDVVAVRMTGGAGTTLTAYGMLRLYADFTND